MGCGTEDRYRVLAPGQRPCRAPQCDSEPDQTHTDSASRRKRLANLLTQHASAILHNAPPNDRTDSCSAVVPQGIENKDSIPHLRHRRHTRKWRCYSPNRCSSKGESKEVHRREASCFPPNLKTGDLVLVSQRKQNKSSTRFCKDPLAIKEIRGTQLILTDIHGKQQWRNSSHVRKYWTQPGSAMPHTVVSHCFGVERVNQVQPIWICCFCCLNTIFHWERIENIDTEGQEPMWRLSSPQCLKSEENLGWINKEPFLRQTRASWVKSGAWFYDFMT